MVMALKPDASSSAHNDVSPPTSTTPTTPNNSDVASLKASIISVKVPALPLSPPLEDDSGDMAHEHILLEAQGNGGAFVVTPGDDVDCGRGDSQSRVVATPNGDLLPTTVTPTHYDIHLHPDLATGVVSGSVSVDARINEATDQIVLHAKSIHISHVTVYHHGTKLCTVDGGSVEYDNSELEMATIHLPCVLQPAFEVTVIIAFKGVLSDSMYGLYRCKYRDRKGEGAEMMVTQFQAKCARMA
ncbi:hypothetical protein GGI20_006366, partial [Coemansia sp. BCRC 34301]